MKHVHAPVILDVAGLVARRRRPAPSRPSADRRPDPVRAATGRTGASSPSWPPRSKSIRADLLICVDHEGGRVQRFRTDGFTALPPMRVLGEMWMDDGAGGRGAGAMRALEAARAAGHVLGAELRACGVDLSFTPVLDLDHGASGVIGDRAFHRDPRVVSLLAQEPDATACCRPACTTAASISPGTASCSADSHLEMPVDDRSLERDPARRRAALRMARRDARERDAGARDLSAASTSGRPDSRRAGCSEILRNELGFDGAIFSDDLSMAGARHVGAVEVSYAEAAALALAAGCDMVLLCNQSVDGGAAVDALLDEPGRRRVGGRLAGRSRQRAATPGSAAADGADRLGRSDAPAGVPALARAAAVTGR